MPELAEELLVPLDAKDIDYFCDTVLASEWPFSIHAYYFIKTTRSWKERSPATEVTFLRSKNSLESGVFVGLLKSGSKTVTMTVYALREHEELLREGLTKSKLIPWSELPLLQGILLHHADILSEVIESFNLFPDLYVVTTLQMLPVHKAHELHLTCPPEVRLAPLGLEHVDEIYEVWPLSDIYTKEELANSISLNVGYGLFLKEDGSLVSWIMQTHYGALGMVQTREDVQRRGYSRLLCKLLSKKLAEMSVQPYAFVRDTNLKSKALFHSIGYSEICKLKYLKVEQKST